MSGFALVPHTCQGTRLSALSRLPLLPATAVDFPQSSSVQKGFLSIESPSLIITSPSHLLYPCKNDNRYSTVQPSILAVNEIALTWIYSPIQAWSGESLKCNISTLHHHTDIRAESVLYVFANSISTLCPVLFLSTVRAQSPPGLHACNRKNTTSYPWQISFCFLKGRACHFITQSVLLSAYFALNRAVICYLGRDRTNIIIFNRISAVYFIR